MEPRVTRIVLSTKDVMEMTGKSERRCLMIMAHVRKYHKKSPRSYVVIEEFCEVMELKVETVVRFLQKLPIHSTQSETQIVQLKNKFV